MRRQQHRHRRLHPLCQRVAILQQCCKHSQAFLRLVRKCFNTRKDVLGQACHCCDINNEEPKEPQHIHDRTAHTLARHAQQRGILNRTLLPRVASRIEGRNRRDSRPPQAIPRPSSSHSQAARPARCLSMPTIQWAKWQRQLYHPNPHPHYCCCCFCCCCDDHQQDQGVQTFKCAMTLSRNYNARQDKFKT